MRDLEELLVSTLNNFVSQQKIFKKSPFSITLSHLEEFDYQSTAESLIRQEKKDDLVQFLNSDTIFGNIFEYQFTDNGKVNFICFNIKKSYLFSVLSEFCSNKLNFKLYTNNSPKETILYDYSSPNLAKDMHIGHLRSTILGDCLANISEYIGHTVLRINHLGDFGLPFGMIVEYIISENIVIDENVSLQTLYIKSKQKFELDQTFQQNSYFRTAELQKEESTISSNIWKQIYEHSLKSYNNIYRMLNISDKLEIIGESFYSKYVDTVKSLLEKSGNLEIDVNGRVLVKVSDMIPLIYIKSEEKGSAFTYDTTDTVALWYRSQKQNANRIYYVVDQGQSLHFSQLIKLGKTIGWTRDIHVEHIDFGVIRGENNQRIKSRDGNTTKLLDVINDCIGATTAEFITHNKDDDETLTDYQKSIIIPVAIGSIKYYELSKCRTTSYQFSFDDMLRFDGNTYTYLIYSIARCRGVIEKMESSELFKKDTQVDPSIITEDDIGLLRKLSYFPGILTKTFNTQMPHHLCEYVHKLVSIFHEHYSHTRCIHYDSDNNIIDYNQSRVSIYVLIKKILETVCSLLGLPIVDRI
jgi:arginyl-tRNA synthetase